MNTTDCREAAATAAAAVEQLIRINYVPKLVARGEGRVYWDTPDGLPPQPAAAESKKEG